MERKTVTQNIRVFISYWWMVIVQAATTVARAVDMRGQTVGGCVLLFLWFFVSVLAANHLLPSSLIEIVKGDFWGAIRLLVATVGFFAIPLFLVHILYQPANIDYDKSQKIKQYFAESLKILPYGSVEDIWLDDSGVHSAVFLAVKNDSEKEEIVELEAEIEYIFQTIINPRMPHSSVKGVVKIPFIDGKRRTSWSQKSISLKPEHSLSFCVAYFGDQNPPQVYFGVERYTESINDKETIYEIGIFFQGHLQGQTEYKNLRYTDIIYSDPSKGRLLMGRDAINIYPDISEPFKEIIHNFYKDRFPAYGSAYLRQQVELPNKDRDKEFKGK